MDLSRRTFLKTMALTGVAAVTSGKLLQTSFASFHEGDQPLRPIIVLIHDLPESSPFLAGVRAAQPPNFAPLIVQRCNRALGFAGVFHTQLHSGEPVQMIGLVDDASAAIVVDLARSAGAQMAWLGQHAVNTAGHSRHRILTAEVGKGSGLRLGQQLNAGGVSFSLTEQSATQPRRVGQMASASSWPPSPSDRWATWLGFILAGLTAIPAAPLPSTPTDTRSRPLVGNFVSFSLQT